MSLIKPSEIIKGSAILSESATGLWGWAGISGLALMTSAVFLAFIYLLGSLFRNPQTIAYVKQELYELFASAILIIFLFAIIASLQSMSIGSFLPQSMIPKGVDAKVNVYDATYNYYSQVSDDMEVWLNMNYAINMLVDQMASVTPYARPLGVGLVASPLAGLAAPIKQLLYNMSVALSVAYIMNYAQLFVFVFSLQAFLKYYLPAGIFLRSFTPTRRLGGTIIGVSAAFLFIFPALSTLTYVMMYNASGPVVSFTSMISAYFGDLTANGIRQHMHDFFISNYTSGLTDLATGVFGGMGSMMQMVVGKTFLALILLPIATIGLAFAIGFVIPAFNILIFTQAAKGLSKSFGEEVDISSLTRLI